MYLLKNAANAINKGGIESKYREVLIKKLVEVIKRTVIVYKNTYDGFLTYLYTNGIAIMASVAGIASARPIILLYSEDNPPLAASQLPRMLSQGGANFLYQ